MPRAKKAPAKGKPLKGQAIDTYMNIDPPPPGSSKPKSAPTKKAS